jgi:hypothetical protein
MWKHEILEGLDKLIVHDPVLRGIRVLIEKGTTYYLGKPAAKIGRHLLTLADGKTKIFSGDYALKGHLPHPVVLVEYDVEQIWDDPKPVGAGQEQCTRRAVAAFPSFLNPGNHICLLLFNYWNNIGTWVPGAFMYDVDTVSGQGVTAAIPMSPLFERALGRCDDDAVAQFIKDDSDDIGLLSLLLVALESGEVKMEAVYPAGKVKKSRSGKQARYPYLVPHVKAVRAA